MLGHVADSRMKPQRTGQLRSEQTKLLYLQAPSTMIATVVGALVLTIVLWDVVSRAALIVWLGFTSFSVLITYRLCRAFRFRRVLTETGDRWRLLLVASLTFTGAMMGSAVVFLSRLWVRSVEISTKNNLTTQDGYVCPSPK